MKMKDVFCRKKLDVIKAKARKCMKDEVLQYINAIRSYLRIELNN